MEEKIIVFNFEDKSCSSYFEKRIDVCCDFMHLDLVRQGSPGESESITLRIITPCDESCREDDGATFTNDLARAFDLLDVTRRDVQKMMEDELPKIIKSVKEDTKKIFLVFSWEWRCSNGVISEKTIWHRTGSRE